MSVKVLFFGHLADKVGLKECSVLVDKSMSLGDLVSAVSCDEYKPFALAVNQQQVTDMNMKIRAGDEVALMPPYSGG